MDVITDVLSSGVIPLDRYAFVMNRTFPEVLERAGRGVVRRVISITPPAAAGVGGLGTSSQAKLNGLRAVDRDLNTIFVPVKIRGRRKERISGAGMVQIHIQHLRHKRPGAKMRRYGGPYYVDKRKFNALALKLRGHVGRLAAGWNAAAAALGVAVPQWIARHGLGRGSYRADLQGSEMFIESVNHASAHAPTEELQRRVSYALDYQAGAMNREMHHILLRRAGESGLQVA